MRGFQPIKNSNNTQSRWTPLLPRHPDDIMGAVKGDIRTGDLL